MQFSLQKNMQCKGISLSKERIPVKQFALQGFRLFSCRKCSKIKVFNIMNRVLNILIVENQNSKKEQLVNI